MISETHWRKLLLIWTAAGIALLLAGWALGKIAEVLLAGALAALAWQAWNLMRLSRWLHQDLKPQPPISSGFWSDLFTELQRVQNRHLKRTQNLTQLLKKMRETVDAMPDAAVILQADGVTRWWNRAARELLGLHGVANQGERIAKFFRNPHFIEFLQHPPSDSRESITLPSPVDERIQLEVRIVPYGDEQVLLLARDVSRLARLESMRRDFVANVSHELRTPLTSIRGLAEILADHPATAHPDLTRPVQMIEQQAQRMQRLVEDLLLLSRLETATRRAGVSAVDVPKLLAIIAEDARTLDSYRGHDIQMTVDPLLWLRGEESELRSSFANLVFNAVQYSPAGGTIRVRWETNGKEGATLSVDDSGIGIAPQDIPRLTERFYRVDKARSVNSGGTGLGLAIVKHVLERHHATLEITSQPGQGSCFRCHFPASAVLRRGS